MANGSTPTDDLLAAPLPRLIKDLGLAVAEANKALRDAGNGVGDPNLVFTINQAEIELNLAMSYERDTKAEFGVGATIYAFNVNASYARTYGYREEASSKIKISPEAKDVWRLLYSAYQVSGKGKAARGLAKRYASRFGSPIR